MYTKFLDHLEKQSNYFHANQSPISPNILSGGKAEESKLQIAMNINKDYIWQEVIV